MIDIDILTDIENMLATVSEADVRRTERSLEEVHESDDPLGVVHSLSVRRLWAVAFTCEGRSIIAHADSHYRANNEVEADDFVALGVYYRGLASLVRAIAWGQAKKDIGGAAWHAESIAIRSGWMLVNVPVLRGPELGGLLQFIRQPRVE